LHDIVDLEARGVVGVVVASSAFTDAAAQQAKSLGADPACVFVPHPIQDRTDEEIRALADAAVDTIVAALTAPYEGTSGAITTA
jgi:alkanesulfonate monooxygenase SsuD/methylene tetrahydromethanopterin reductase-like flavin-dependent oxidoreductase (luciferase family)